MKKKIMAVLLSSVLLLSSCGNNNNAGTTNAGSESPSSGGQTASGGSSGGESSPVKASSDDMWEILPKIDETPVEYLSYHITDEIGSEIGIIVDGILEPGITKIRLPERIEGKPVVGVDLIDDKVTELILPETVQPVYINLELIEYMNYTADMVLNDDLYSYYKETRFVEITDMPNLHPARFNKKTLKGIYVSSSRNKYLDEFYFSNFSDTKVMYNGNVYDNTNLYKMFVENPYLGLKIKGTKVTTCNKLLKEITIPEGITEVHLGASDHLETVNFPSTLTTIGHIPLKELVIPDSVTKIEAFGDLVSNSKDEKIETIVIGSGITELPEECFCNLSNLKSITLEKNLKSIGMHAFENCKSLERIVIPGTIKTIEEFTFSGCENLKEVIIEDGVESIKSDAFDYCYALSSVTVPDSVKSIEPGAFLMCRSLTSVSIPSGCKYETGHLASFPSDCKIEIRGSGSTESQSAPDEKSMPYEGNWTLYTYNGLPVKEYADQNGCTLNDIMMNISVSQNKMTSQAPSESTCDIQYSSQSGFVLSDGLEVQYDQINDTLSYRLDFPDTSYIYVFKRGTYDFGTGTLNMSASETGNDTTSQAGSDNICAVDILGNTIADVEQMYGIKLTQNGSTYTADNFPYELSVSQFDSYTFISSVIITGDGRLDDTIKCGMTYNEIKAASKAPIYDPYYSEELYKGVAANIDFDFAVAIVVWDTSNADDIGDMPCSKIEYSSAM